MPGATPIRLANAVISATVRNWRNELVVDSAHRAEIKRALLFAIQE